MEMAGSMTFTTASRIRDLVRAQPGIIGIHDLIVHDYGPGRRILSLHAEVPASGDILGRTAGLRRAVTHSSSPPPPPPTSSRPGNPLLGQPPSPEFVARIRDLVRAQPGIIDHVELHQNGGAENPGRQGAEVHRLGMEDFLQGGFPQLRPHQQDDHGDHQPGDILQPPVAEGVVLVPRLSAGPTAFCAAAWASA